MSVKPNQVDSLLSNMFWLMVSKAAEISRRQRLIDDRWQKMASLLYKKVRRVSVVFPFGRPKTIVPDWCGFRSELEAR